MTFLRRVSELTPRNSSDWPQSREQTATMLNECQIQYVERDHQDRVKHVTRGAMYENRDIICLHVDHVIDAIRQSRLRVVRDIWRIIAAVSRVEKFGQQRREHENDGVAE